MIEKTEDEGEEDVEERLYCNKTTLIDMDLPVT